ncbi:hypothetical protein OG548_18480 [Streptomyces sp. NBC_01356]|uniref:hypothetical protein n=1 Tax=Streptomyces sp. NBC_01356 TaxID=2903836 RepID=UPI002E369BBC|nr:hypothetical protein [Streptomyces sp. NBC_01356]
MHALDGEVKRQAIGVAGLSNGLLQFLRELLPGLGNIVLRESGWELRNGFPYDPLDGLF